jgi:hypothetical protein
MLALLALLPCLFDCLTARHSSIIVKRKAPQGKLNLRFLATGRLRLGTE